ncbi:MAG: carboxymuconolactone decarboxylase family protein [Halanaerobiales bacterium]
MAWIKMVEESEADGKLKKLYDKIMNPENNKVANILKVHSLNPEVLEAHLKLYKTIMFGKSKISRRQREMIAVVVSGVNSCHY